MSEVHFADESVTLHWGDALDVARGMPDASADCIVTSPPYFGLRDYGNDGQYGLEETPAEYVETMRALFSELRRVLSDDGSLWVNIGDSYGKDKNLLGIPWRVAFALQDDGWTLRSDVVWAKRNCLPDPATDRPSRAHEYVFQFSKGRKYWFDVDAIREDSDPAQQAHNERYAREYEGHTARAAETGQPGNVNNVGIHSRPGKGGRPSRTVWSISAQPFAGAHFAVMPLELAERCIKSSCKPGGTVLDPFSGSGTTGLAATRHGRKYVGIDLSRDYLDMSLRTRLQQGGLDFGGPQ